MEEPFPAVVGVLKQESVLAVRMPRAQFLEAVDHVLDEMMVSAGFWYEVSDVEEVRALIRPVAARIERFPLSAWVAESRGCGCLVGEYLIAHDLLSRESAASKGVSYVTVRNVLRSAHAEGVTRTLIEFGAAIDSYLRKLVLGTECADVILIEGTT